MGLIAGSRSGVGQVRALLLLFGTLLMLAVFVGSASADLSVCTTGSAAGQCKNPIGVAVDTSSGHLYVADAGNNRIDVFDSSGSFLFAFGWKVNVATPEEKLQTCTSVSACQKGTAGPGAGQLNHPEQVAVDSSSHEVFVSETENHRVQRFDPSGAFKLAFGREVNKTAVENARSGEEEICPAAGHPADVCQGGKAGAGEGQFEETLAGGLPIAVGPGGTVYVADSKKIGLGESEGFKTRIQKFEAFGAPIGPQLFLPGTVSRVQAIAVDSGGDVYEVQGGSGGAAENIGVRKFHPDGTSYGAPYPLDHQSVNIQALGLDGTDDLYLTDFEGEVGEVREYDPAGTELRAIYGAGPLQDSGLGLAVFQSAAGDVFVSERAGQVVDVPFPPAGPVSLPGSCKASGVISTRATFKCQVNPQGKASEYHFEYVNKATYEADQPNGFEHATSTGEAAVPGEVSGEAGFRLRGVETKLPNGSLAPETEYRFRIVTRNADSGPGGNPQEGEPFETKGPAEVLETWATEVGSDSALAHAEVNPLGVAATGHFEYVDDATYRHDVGELGPGHGFDHAKATAGSIDFGSGEKPVTADAQITGLIPATTYHYRLQVEGSLGTALGEERILRTFPLAGAQPACPNQAFRSGASAALSDCRAYEMVSPVDKDNGDILTRVNVFGYPTNLDQSAAQGSGFTYSSYRAFADPKGAPYTSQFLAGRDPEGGWSSEAIDPPRGPQFLFQLENTYKAFSADLSSGWLLQESEPTLDPCAPAGFADIYHHSAGTYGALSCEQPEGVESRFFLPELEGFSADGSTAVFRADAALTLEASGASSEGHRVFQVYESVGGQLQLVSVLPNRRASGLDSAAGTAFQTNPSEPYNFNRFGSLEGAVSADGSRVFWSTRGEGGGGIYLRENVGGEQSEDGSCDEPGKACTVAVSATVSPQAAFFQKANAAGTKALFTVTAGPLAGNLYEFDAGAEPPTSQLIGEGVLGNILGASADLSRVYFASTKASAGAAVEGQPNIYLAEGGTTRFVATLSSGGETSDVNNPYGTPTGTPIKRTARVSPNGASLVLMSNSRELSEKVARYDNTDASSPARCGSENEKGEAGICDTEVYLYDAEAGGGSGELRCVSCNPSGERPSGRALAEANGGAAHLFMAARVPTFESQLYQPRYLSDQGDRVFFDSFDPLVLSDTNSEEDAYEWEALGTGSCSSASSTYVPASEGCLSLISSGQSPADSEFLDAGTSGSDAFFSTVESLLPQDPGLVDVYDARAFGGFPPPPSQPGACEGEACQSPPAPPNDPTPASSSFEGAGNVKPAKKKPAKKKSHHKKKHHHKRRATR